ncbi:MAG: hypothetical protein NE330_16455 [Lentisphaeraceae bacterium]|nr:hypothetical protein [Lentisphaeraceae bacterium]
MLFRLSRVLCLVFFGMSFQFVYSEVDLSDKVEKLGVPYGSFYRGGAKIYARNVWDLKAFDGRLYIGAGNSSNLGPARNAGPLPIISWDPKTQKFVEEFTIQDEQIDLFYEFDGQLYTPGHDPKESWKLGNFYRLEDSGKWQKHRTIPGGIHVYAMHQKGSRLYAGLGAINAVPNAPKGKKSGSAVAVSEDKGKTWQKINTGGWRIHSFLEVAGEVYATDIFIGPDYVKVLKKMHREELYAPVYEFEKGKVERRLDLPAEVIFKGFKIEGMRMAKVVKPQIWNGGALYIGAACHNDHQFWSFGLFYALSLKKGEVKTAYVKLPEACQIWDLKVRNGTIYVLARALDGSQTNYLFKSKDLSKKFETVLTFKSSTFARSFEFLDGDAYFGLGSTIRDPQKWKQSELHEQTGTLLRIKSEFFQP